MATLTDTSPDTIERDDSGNYRFIYRNSAHTKYTVAYSPNRYKNTWHAVSFRLEHDSAGKPIATHTDTERPLEPDEIEYFERLAAGRGVYLVYNVHKV